MSTVEATRRAAEDAFAAGVPRVELRVDVTDVAAVKDALAAGFRYEGVARGGLDGTRDVAVLARLATDPHRAAAPSLAPLPDGGLSDGIVLVRVAEASDGDALIEQDRDPLTVASGFTGVAPAAEDARRMVARAGLEFVLGNAAMFSVIDVATGSFAGSVRLRMSGPPQVGGIGYAVHPEFRGRGYTARALRLIVPWAFEAAGFARLELGAKVDNIASQRAALAGGFVPDGMRAQRLRAPDGTFHDEVRFVLLNPANP